MTHGSFERFVAIAARRELDSLLAELTYALSELPENERPYVAGNLQRALDMFLDSYGSASANLRDDNAPS